MTIQLKTSLPHYDFTEVDEKVFRSFMDTIHSADIGFYHVSKRADLIQSTKDVWNNFSAKKTFVHVGIGGSSLGPEMMISALGKNSGTKFVFINNVDPEEMSDKLSHLDFHDCVFYFVSKSGGTAETMAALAIIMQGCIDRGISENQFRDHFVFATDPIKSDLLALAQTLQIQVLEVPSNVGGRFTALTPVGYLPCLAAGIDIDSLISGAEKIKAEIEQKDPQANLLRLVAAYIFNMKEQKGITQTVFMPYSSKLRDLAFWFTQLWAESLGKKYNIHGKVVCSGLTPIPAYGATDQHSQMQLFMEGPMDKCLLLLEVENFGADFSLQNSIDLPAFKKLAPHTLQQLLRAELYGTMKALELAQRPYIHLSITKNDEESLGASILFFECLTVFLGLYLEINPFDQPGVEAGKKYAYEFLSKTQSLN